MGEEIVVRVLGPVEVRVAGAWEAAGTPQRRLLLAMLALAAGQVVSVAELIDALWGEHPPRSAHASLQVLVTRLRQVLAGISGGLECCGYGYRLGLPPGLVDVHRFRALASAARQASDPDDAIAALDEALGLWRGPALADVPGTDRVEVIREGLASEYLSVAADRIGWLVASGRERAATAELPALLARYPLAERLAGMFMVALYRCGQRAEAVRVFLGTRARLAAELDVEPGPELQRLYQRILAGDPQLATTAAAPDSAAGRAATLAAGPGRHLVPAQLPAVTPIFAGRTGELAALDELVSNPADATGPAVCVISGTAGVGKTTLALHWAHRAAPRFPDGQLHVDLRGFGPSAAPVTAGQAIRGFLRALGVPAPRVPRSLDAQAALYRSTLAGKRVLAVLDNAQDAGQVRPLLAGGQGCVVLVTSRSQLTGLVAAEGARALSLDLMPDEDACEVLTRRIGVQRAAAEPEAVAELAGLCARLPLALAIAAARAQERAGLPLAALASELRDSQQRLDCLETGDPASSVREVLSWSQHQLSGAASRMFRLLGTHPGPDISAPAAASLAGVPVRQARHLLAELARAHLLAEHCPGRFACHDLLRAYSAEQAQTNSDAARRAHRRVLDYYLHSANAATWLLYPTRDPLTLNDPQPGVVPENLSSPAQGLAWFRSEQQALLAAATHAAAAGLDSYAWQLAAALTDYLNRQGYWHDLEAIQATALTAARRAGDLFGQAHAHLGLGTARLHTASPEDARSHLERAISLFGQLGDRARQARSYVTLGNADAQQARYRLARRHTEHALCLYLHLGRRGGQALALTNLGWLHAKLGDYQAALTCCEQALQLHRELGNLSGQAHTWGHLGYARHCLADNVSAITCYQRALRLLRDLSDRPEQASVLTRLGDTYQRSGDLPAARNARKQALDILKDLQRPTTRQARAGALQPPGPGHHQAKQVPAVLSRFSPPG